MKSGLRIYTSPRLYENIKHTKLSIPYVKITKVHSNGTYVTRYIGDWPSCGCELDMSILLTKMLTYFRNDQNTLPKIIILKSCY